MVKFETSLELESFFNCHGPHDDVILTDIGCASGEFASIVPLTIHKNLPLNCKATSFAGDSGSQNREEG